MRLLACFVQLSKLLKTELSQSSSLAQVMLSAAVLLVVFKVFDQPEDHIHQPVGPQAECLVILVQFGNPEKPSFN